MHYAVAHVALLGGIALSFCVPNLARRFPGNTWFVLSHGRFDVPRESLTWELLRISLALAGLTAAAGLGDGSSPSLRFVAGLAVVGVGLTLARQAAPAPISLTPHGVRIWQIYRFRTVPWAANRRPARSYWRPVAVPWVAVDAVLAHYMANADDRARIGTGAEYDRLTEYLEPDPNERLVRLNVPTERQVSPISKSHQPR